MPLPEAAARRCSRTLLLLAAALLVPAAAGRAQGVVGLLNKERRVAPQPTPMILEETLDTVRFRTKSGAERSEQTLDIAWIEYGPGSAAFEKGLRALEAGDAAGAEALFAEASADEQPPWVAAHALLRQAEAAARRGKQGLPAARAALAAFLERFPDHRLLPQALIEQARRAAQAGDPPTVDSSVAAVVALGKDERITPDWVVRSQLVAGESQLQAGNVKAATTAYAEAERAADAGRSRIAERPDLQPVLEQLALEARVGNASCLLAADDVSGARSAYQQLGRDGGSDRAVQAAVANGLAECDFRDPARLKEAQLGFARVAVTAADVPAERARALYFLARCADELGRQQREPDARARATAYLQEVVSRYPGTRWAALAQESLP